MKSQKIRNFEIQPNFFLVNKDIRSDAPITFKLRNKTITDKFELIKEFNSSIFITQILLKNISYRVSISHRQVMCLLIVTDNKKTSKHKSYKRKISWKESFRFKQATGA